jgi:class 3 adenylate cyclase/YHS domain-containing protein
VIVASRERVAATVDTIARVNEPVLTFAFVDLAGYTALTEQHGDLDAADCAERFYRLAERSLVGDTRIVKKIGDAVMLVSSEPSSCVSTVCALFAAADAEPSFPALRAGINAGAVVERDGDYFGAAVNLAARIGAHARSGEVLCGEAVSSAVARAGRVRAVPLGKVALKNIAHPVSVWSLLEPEPPVVSGVVDPVCRMRVARPHVSLEHEGRRYSFCSDACAERFRADPTAFTAPTERAPG